MRVIAAGGVPRVMLRFVSGRGYVSGAGVCVRGRCLILVVVRCVRDRKRFNMVTENKMGNGRTVRCLGRQERSERCQ